MFFFDFHAVTLRRGYDDNAEIKLSLKTSRSPGSISTVNFISFASSDPEHRTEKEMLFKASE